MLEIKTFQPVDHNVNALVYGASGIGKTVFGGTAPKPIFASAEGGLLSISDKAVPFVEIRSLKDLQDLLQYLKTEKHDYQTIIIDSISEINEIIKLEIEKKTGKSMQLQDWGELSKKIKAILRGFRDLPMHTLFIAQETFDRDEDRIEKILPSLNGKSSTDIASFMDIVGYLMIEKGTGQRKMITNTNPKLISKDRSRKIGNDTEVDFGVWVDKIKAIKLGDQKTVTEIGEDAPKDQTIVEGYIEEVKEIVEAPKVDQAPAEKPKAVEEAKKPTPAPAPKPVAKPVAQETRSPEIMKSIDEDIAYLEKKLASEEASYKVNSENPTDTQQFKTALMAQRQKIGDLQNDLREMKAKRDPQEVVETPSKEAEIEPEDLDDVEKVEIPAMTGLPTSKVKNVQITWKNFAEKKGWKVEESDKRKKATLNKYYQIENVNDLTVEQADDFVAKLNKAIESVI